MAVRGFPSSTRCRTLIATVCAFAAPCFAQTPFIDWLDDPEDWFDEERHSARAAYQFRESQTSLWLEDDDATAVRTTTGSVSGDKLFLFEQLRLDGAVHPYWHVRFFHERHEDIGITEQEFRSEMEHRNPAGLTASAFATGVREKEDLDFGVGAGWRWADDRFLRFRWVQHRWIYNEKNNEKGRYDSFPHRIEASGRVRTGALLLTGEGLLELPWELRFSDASLSQGRRRMDGRQWSFDLRVQQGKSRRMQGGWIRGKGLTQRESFFPVAGGQHWKRDANEWSARVFMLRPVGSEWTWEGDVTAGVLDRADVERATGDDRLKVRDVFSQHTVRRSFGSWFFGEGMIQGGVRDVTRSGSLAKSRTERESNWRVGFAWGFLFPGKNAAANRKLERPVRGELRLRVMQHLDRSWVGSFGGGNLMFVFVW